MTTFYFIRHGNAYDAHGEQTPESHLNPTGIRQAEVLKSYLKDGRFDSVLVSPFNRALDTCKISAPTSSPKPQIIKELIEVGSGMWPAPTDSAVPQVLEDEFDAVKKEVANFLKEAVAKYEGQEVLIFTHGNRIRAIISVTLGLDARAQSHLYIDFVSITKIRYDSSGFPTILSVSETPGKTVANLIE
ncbi:MAG: histidine phosphatase family protein [candidate division WWE3 bacterium]|nr:histidine phosphatase family protein [candidate division WWE3 bacterium]